MRTRTGTFVKQRTGYVAFIPASLPPEPPIESTEAIANALRSAQIRIDRGASDGWIELEAYASCAIEGISEPAAIARCESAIRHVCERQADLPLSMRLLREAHFLLMSGDRESETHPGDYRRSQNWIGPAGSSLGDAVFVPPPVEEMKTALGDLEKFLHDDSIDPLMRAALSHFQFETIHPFLDGNGRIGRILAVAMLGGGIALSSALKRREHEYVSWLTRAREFGEIEGWCEFFLTCVGESS